MRFLLPSFFLTLFCYCPSALEASSKDDIIQEIISEADNIRAEGEYEAAIKILQKAIKKYEGTNAVADSSIAKLYHKISINFFYNDQFNKALEAADQAIGLRSKALEEGHPDLANSWYLRGVIHSYAGNFAQAQKDINASIITFEENTSLPPAVVDSILAGYYIQMGNVSSETGDLYQSILFWDKSQQYYLQKYGPQNEKYAFLHDRKGTAYHDLKRYDMALHHFTKALDILQSKGESAEKEDLAIVYTNLSRTALELSMPQKAKTYALEALKINQELDYPTEICNLYANLVDIYRQLKAPDQAEDAFQKGLRLAKKTYQTSYHPTLAELYTNMGKVKFDQENYAAALQFFQQSIGALVPNLDPEDLQQTPSASQDYIEKKADLLIPLMLKANAYFKRFLVEQNLEDLLFAQTTYEALDSFVMQVRQSLKTGESKYALHNRLVPAYENGIWAALRLFERTKDSSYLKTAYSFATRNKAIVLLEGRQDEQAKYAADIPEDLLYFEEELELEYYKIERTLYDLQQANDQAAFQAKKQDLFDLKRAYDRFVEQLENQYPEYYQAKYAPVDLPSLPEIQKKLAPDRAVLDFFVGTKAIFIFVLTSSGFDYYRLQKPNNFNQTCFQFRKALTIDQPDATSITQYTSTAYQIYQWLLQETLQDLPSKIKRLTIIPDDILLQVAFDVLLTQKVEDWRGAMQPYLIRDYALSYAYSNKLLFNSESQRNNWRQRSQFGGFGLEYNDYTLEGLSQFDTITQTRGLSEALRSVGKLLYSDDEVLEISSLLKGQVWINQDATKKTFLERAQEYNILHLAMHGVVDEEQPMNSALIFSRTSDSLDYFLYASDIYNLTLPNTEMVVLSACNTGYGQLNRGEGVRSLVRAFAYAGSPSTVATFWSAPDKPTKDIMLEFYANLKSKQPKDIALQEAKLEYLNQSSQEYTAPPYWAHLMVAGEVEPIFKRTFLNRYSLLIVAILIFVGLYRFK